MRTDAERVRRLVPMDVGVVTVHPDAVILVRGDKALKVRFVDWDDWLSDSYFKAIVLVPALMTLQFMRPAL